MSCHEIRSHRARRAVAHGHGSPVAAALLALVGCQGADLPPDAAQADAAASPLPGTTEAGIPDAWVPHASPDAGPDAADEDAGRPPTPARRTLFVVAHQDDDVRMVFRHRERFERGEAIRVVYTTNGDPATGCASYVGSREQGMKEVYAEAAGLPGAPDCSHQDETGCWAESERDLSGKRLRQQSLRGTRVSMVFLGLQAERVGLPGAQLRPSLERLWLVPDARVPSRETDGRSRVDSYTRQTLLDLLEHIVEEFQPTHVITLEPDRHQPLTYPFDHTDHVHTAFFTLAALQRLGLPVELTLLRNYNVMFDPPNLSEAETQLANHLFYDVYAPHDPLICAGDSTSAELCGAGHTCDPLDTYHPMDGRYYEVEIAEGMHLTLGAPKATCLTAVDGLATGGACTQDSTTRWQLAATGQVVDEATGTCLTAAPDGAVTLGPCEPGSPDQHFLLLSNGSLLGPEARCATLTGNGLRLAPCATQPAQKDFGVAP